MRLFTHTVSVQSSRMTVLCRAFYRLSFFNCRQTAQIATVFTAFSCPLGLRLAGLSVPPISPMAE